MKKRYNINVHDTVMKDVNASSDCFDIITSKINRTTKIIMANNTLWMLYLEDVPHTTHVFTVIYLWRYSQITCQTLCEIERYNFLRKKGISFFFLDFFFLIFHFWRTRLRKDTKSEFRYLTCIIVERSLT